MKTKLKSTIVIILKILLFLICLQIIPLLEGWAYVLDGDKFNEGFIAGEFLVACFLSGLFVLFIFYYILDIL